MSETDVITLAVWRDASTDPPKRDTERYWWTDEGEARYFAGLWLGCDGPITPRWYCDPKPPGENAITIDDLRDIAEIVESEARHSDGVMGGVQEWWDLAARLRAALDAVNAEKDGTP